MNVTGYSERGLINALFYEINYSGNSSELIRGLLSLISFPYKNNGIDTEKILDVDILIEQSLSDFGDADAILLLNNIISKQAIFIEAKIASQKHWSIINKTSLWRNKK